MIRAHSGLGLGLGLGPPQLEVEPRILGTLSLPNHLFAPMHLVRLENVDLPPLGPRQALAWCCRLGKGHGVHRAL